MLHAILILLGCQLIGEVISRGLSLPVPGPVIGMAVLFCTLQFRAHLGRARAGKAADVAELPLGAVAAFLLANLSLLFVPAGTGIVRQIDVLAAHGVGLIVALVVSTALTLIVTALVFTAVARRSGGE
jgi:holin-like protein